LTGWDRTRIVAELIAAKWVVPIMAALEPGSCRYVEIRRQVGPVSRKVLTDTLRRLDHVGLIEHVFIDRDPPAVGYSLTRVGYSLLEPMAELRAWYDAHAHELNLDEPDGRNAAGLGTDD
jgi:DNA-binding HxlR family transcriptional regulator